VQVALRPARGHVAPGVARLDAPQAREESDDRALELARVDTVIGCDERVAEVVDGVAQEAVQVHVLVHQVVWIAQMARRPFLHLPLIGIEDGALARR